MSPLDHDERPWGRAWKSPRRAEVASQPVEVPGDTHVAGRRIVAHLLDFAVYTALAVGGEIFLVGALAPSSWFAGPGSTYVWVFGAIALNWVILQGLTGYSVGKAIVRVRVVKRDGVTPGLWAALVRTLPLVIEQWGVFGIWAMYHHPAGQRFGDRWARTFVVRARTATTPRLR